MIDWIIFSGFQEKKNCPFNATTQVQVESHVLLSGDVVDIALRPCDKLSMTITLPLPTIDSLRFTDNIDLTTWSMENNQGLPTDRQGWRPTSTRGKTR